MRAAAPTLVGLPKPSESSSRAWRSSRWINSLVARSFVALGEGVHLASFRSATSSSSDTSGSAILASSLSWVIRGLSTVSSFDIFSPSCAVQLCARSQVDVQAIQSKNASFVNRLACHRQQDIRNISCQRNQRLIHSPSQLTEAVVAQPRRPAKLKPGSGLVECGSSSVGRALPCQGRGRQFESGLPLHQNIPARLGCFVL